MIDPRVALRAVLARWLHVRADVRAIAAKVAAAQLALQHDARRSDDPQMATLVAQLAAERSTIDVMAGNLDDRIAGLRRESSSLDSRFIADVVSESRRPRE